jgi:Family of unknown function (DUF6328)
LLTVPFTARFVALSGDQRLLYLATLAEAGAAAMLLIAPGAQHRILFRCGDKEHIVRMANRYAIAGVACVALAMVGAVLFVAEVVLSSRAAGAAGVVSAAARCCAGICSRSYGAGGCTAAGRNSRFRRARRRCPPRAAIAPWLSAAPGVSARGAATAARARCRKAEAGQSRSR